ncbi:MAG: ATP phosphoribosyltransferase regulatory subunit, partial [Deltaproteobacteria bacterium]|nr:ATP phosphoribosyltransferase regulatory subunit [Deltaproteobacteria bacterium]
GVVFQLLAEGPGEAFGSGGRYDRLLDRFGAPRPAAGFGLDLGNLAWALARAGALDPVIPRVLVRGDATLAAALRARGVPVARAPAGAALDYARAWRYTHLLSADAAGGELVDVAAGRSHSLPGKTPADLSERVVALLGPVTRATSEGS